MVEEAFHSVWSEFNNVSSAIRIPDEIWLDSKFLIIISWVTPKDIHNKLLLRSSHLVNDLQRSLDLLDLLKVHKCGPDSTVDTHNLVFNHCSEGKPIKQVIDLVEHRIRFSRVFPKSI